MDEKKQKRIGAFAYRSHLYNSNFFYCRYYYEQFESYVSFVFYNKIACSCLIQRSVLYYIENLTISKSRNSDDHIRKHGKKANKVLKYFSISITPFSVKYKRHSKGNETLLLDKSILEWF